VRINGIPPFPRRAPGRRAARLVGTGLRLTPGITAGREVGIQATHTGQPAGDRARRQARLAVLQPHHPLTQTGSALKGHEREDICGVHLGRFLGNHTEEDLQIRGHRQPGVGPGSRRNESQVVIQQRMPQRDRGQLRPTMVTDQARHELVHRGLLARRSTDPRPGGRPAADHPYIKHESIASTQIYMHTDLAVKQRALDRTAQTEATTNRYQPPDALLAYLESL